MKQALVFKKTIILIILNLTLFSGNVFADDPKVILKSGIDQFLSILEDDSLKGEDDKQVRHGKMAGILKIQFDYREMSKRALGKPWRDLSDAQRKEFTDVFGTLLQNTYIEKLEKYSNEKITYGDTRQVNEKKVVIATTILSQGNEYPILYSMMLKRGTWRVYDVKIEGVGLISNYRSQFKKTFNKDGFDVLLDKLKKKIA